VCAASARPDTDACAISDDYGVFVSATTGVDGPGRGGHAAPLKTLAAGLAATKSGPKRLYACANAGVFAERLTLSAEYDGVDVYGGFDCSNLDQWTYSTTLQAEIKPSDPIGATINGLVAGTTLQDLKITASDATTAGDSSFGMIVNGSQNVLLRHVAITAGKGADGAAGDDGDDGPNGADAQDSQKGMNADCSAAPPEFQSGGYWAAAEVVCSSQGGTGGQAFKSAVSNGNGGSDGAPYSATLPPAIERNGAPATTDSAATGATGGPGANGIKGSTGSAAAEIGMFSALGYTPASGNDGTDGKPGQGGGGGAASKGNGTCVGASGGASVALLVWQSGIALDACTLVAQEGGAGANGGNGGSAGLGKTGAAGGVGNPTYGIPDGGGGGKGGNGAPGGSGSGGSGGPSVALVHNGSAPDHPNSSLSERAGGAKGLGGSLGPDVALDGLDGGAMDELGVQ
jgi:hypothetical protein